eukprot:45157_1
MTMQEHDKGPPTEAEVLLMKTHPPPKLNEFIKYWRKDKGNPERPKWIDSYYNAFVVKFTGVTKYCPEYQKFWADLETLTAHFNRATQAARHAAPVGKPPSLTVKQIGDLQGEMDTCYDKWHDNLNLYTKTKSEWKNTKEIKRWLGSNGKLISPVAPGSIWKKVEGGLEKMLRDPNLLWSTERGGYATWLKSTDGKSYIKWQLVQKKMSQAHRINSNVYNGYVQQDKHHVLYGNNKIAVGSNGYYQYIEDDKLGLGYDSYYYDNNDGDKLLGLGYYNYNYYWTLMCVNVISLILIICLLCCIFAIFVGVIGYIVGRFAKKRKIKVTDEYKEQVHENV